jgi:EmrB/QacA subfamily drug resistance transporter
MPNAIDSTSGNAAGLSRELVVLAAVVILGTSMTVLDLTIVNVAVPTLGSDLDTDLATVQWVLTGYMLAFASVIPLAGWASERFGAKRVWLASLLVFMLGSALAGAAWSVGSLVAFRVVQGLGAGMILPVGQTILAQAAGPQRMGRVMSLFGVPLLLVPVLGPVVGGAIVDATSWRWIFFLNLPVGVAAVVAAQRLLPATKPRPGQRVDVLGLALLPPGIAIFLYGLAEAGDHGGFGNTRTIAAVSIGLALVLLFVWHAARRGTQALIDVSLFRRRGFAAASATNFLFPIALFGSLILLPLYYQLVRHETPLDVGLLLAPQAVGAALAMPLAGVLTDRIGARTVVSSGIAIALVATLAFTQIGADTPSLYLSAALLVLGFGMGGTIMPSMAAAFAELTHEETPRATSAINAIQRIAGGIGTALFAIVLQRVIATDVPGSQGGVRGLSELSQQADARSAVADAFGTTFWVAVGLIALAIVPALLLPRARREQPATETSTRDEPRKAA